MTGSTSCVQDAPARAHRRSASAAPHLFDDLMEQVIARGGRLTMIRDGSLRPARRSASGPPMAIHDQIEKLTEGDPRFQLMTEVGSSDHLITVPPAHLLLVQVPLMHQIAHDLLHRPLGDPDSARYVTHPGVRVQRQRDQDVPMVRQERPLSLTHRKHTTRVLLRKNVPHRWDCSAGLHHGVVRTSRKNLRALHLIRCPRTRCRGQLQVTPYGSQLTVKRADPASGRR